MLDFIIIRLHTMIFSVFLIALTFSMSGSLFGQDGSNVVNDAVRPPDKEKFVVATDLVVPWRSNRCWPTTANPEKGCRIVMEKVYLNSHRVQLYNADGSVWFRFSLWPREPDYFLRDPKIVFKPFGTNPTTWPDMVALRMTGESPNWYEVEINEDSRETKFVLKSDPLWAKSKWEFWFNVSFNFVIDNDRTKLLDKPGGKIIEESANINFRQLMFLKAEGDWVYVQGLIPYGQTYRGWIRWRKGRDILVGWIFNDNKIPEPTTIADDK